MDSGGWIHGYVNNTSGGGNNGFMCGYAAVSRYLELMGFIEL